MLNRRGYKNMYCRYFLTNKIAGLIECSKDGANRTFESSKNLLNDAVSGQSFGNQANCQAEHCQATIQLFVEYFGLVNGVGVVSHGEKFNFINCNVL